MFFIWGEKVRDVAEKLQVNTGNLYRTHEKLKLRLFQALEDDDRVGRGGGRQVLLRRSPLPARKRGGPGRFDLQKPGRARDASDRTRGRGSPARSELRERRPRPRK
jgi:hypothetical protein